MSSSGVHRTCIFFRRSRSLNLRHIFPWKLIGLLFRLALQPSYPVAPLAWVPWGPGNPSISEAWVLEPINFGKTRLNSILFSVQSKLKIGFGSLGPSISIWEPINLNSQRSHYTIKQPTKRVAPCAPSPIFF